MKNLMIIIVLLLSTSSLYGADIVTTYTDEDGNLIYTNQKKESKPKTTLENPISSAQPPRQKVFEWRDPIQPTKEHNYTFMPPPVPVIKQPNVERFNRDVEKAMQPVATFIGTLMLFFIIHFIIWIICLIDILRNEFTGSNKVIWFLATLFLPYLGPILYFFIGLNHKKLPGIPDEFQ